jgi:hypothetical protein
MYFRKKIWKLLIPIYASVLILPATLMVSCTPPTESVFDRIMLSNPEQNLKDKLITDRDNFTDILIGMGLKPTAQAMLFKLANPKYFRDINVNVPIFDGFVSGFGSPFNVEAFDVYKPRFFVGSGPDSQFPNIFQPNYNVLNETNEKVLIEVSDEAKGQKEYDLVDLYKPWIQLANEVDKYFPSEDKKRSEVMSETIVFIKDKIKSVREALNQKKINIDEQNNKKSILFYTWGEDKDASKKDLLNNEIYQSAIIPIGPIGYLLYSDSGLAFKAPQFNKSLKLGLGNWGIETTTGNSQLQQAVSLQNDNAVISFNYPFRKNPSLSDFLDGQIWSTRLAKSKNNIKIMPDTFVPTASYGPVGINHMLNFFIRTYSLELAETFIPGTNDLKVF